MNPWQQSCVVAELLRTAAVLANLWPIGLMPRYKLLSVFRLRSPVLPATGATSYIN